MMINVGDRIVNTFVYPIQDGYVMIDTGYENTFQSREKRLKKKNICVKDIKYIFLTHAHDDHAGFLNDILQENREIRVIMSSKGLDTLKKGQNPNKGGCSGLQSYLFCQILRIFGKGSHTFPPIKTEFEGNLWFLTPENQAEMEDKIEGTILETPGHTSDSISLMTKEGNLFCGDMAMSGIPSKNNMIIWIENKEEYERSWKKSLETEVKMIYPAHGSPFSVAKLEKNIKKICKIKLIPMKQD
ncbi:MAG: MBL fold metallo-hydrolase [Eubacteriales bacterium]